MGLNNLKKVGIILDTEPHIGGGYQYSLCMLQALIYATEKQGVSLLCFYLQDEWREIIDNSNLAKYSLSGRMTEDIALIDGENCDVIIGTGQSGWSNKLCTPVIEPIHDLMHRYQNSFPEVADGIEEKLRDCYFSSVVRNAVGILVDSEVGATQVLEAYGRCHENRVHVLPFAAPDYLHDRCEKVVLPFEKYFFYPAQFWLHKNHENLLKAIIQLRNQGIVVNVVFVGSRKNAYDRVLEIINSYELSEQVYMLDYVSNNVMRYLYENSRALVMPTFFGPTNIPPLEALSLNCPIAVSGIYGMPEQLGDAAVYFDPNNVDEISSVLHRLWIDDELCSSLRENGKKRKNLYTQKAFNLRFESILDRVCTSVVDRKKTIKGITEFCGNHDSIYIYGAGNFAKLAISVLRRYHICIKAIIVSNYEENKNAECIFDKCVIAISELEKKSGDGFICAVSDAYMDDVKKDLMICGVNEKDIYKIDREFLANATWDNLL